MSGLTNFVEPSQNAAQTDEARHIDVFLKRARCGGVGLGIHP